MSLYRFIVLLPLLFAQPLWAATVTAAVAANFTRPMQALADRFEAETGHQLRLSFGSSGQLFAQIQNGAPFDVFLSADQAKPEALIDAGDALADSRFTYAVGALALWSATPNRIQDGEALLRRGDFNRLAIANPRLAPYGAAAMDVLGRLGLNEPLADHIVQGQNIAQTHQFVATGNADLGLVALSQIIEAGQIASGSAWIIPSDYYHPIRQDAVLLSRAQDNTAALALLAFLRSDTSQALIETYGYHIEVPQ
ncbi:molybdate ABC transporter substrate-binding protein [Saccharospirillum sp. MSK14-1]|uniref:molybdate ABC transporter substrate-binding protein n=1 Tax=Saccharospirillum sp. MSK14-1 TaxID=1897632 RepID=UPI000D3C8472|nr:molybdate ABC transporter substrate-binding protein [Saccharospirillum sp. MSK14-1]PTY35634.1 molybdate ABC transporter substrate-binding protein [Saccharospirillum sp. MSK14-1]